MASIRERNGTFMIDFQYLGQRRREQTLLPVSSVNRKKLQKLIEKMEAEIILGMFDYQKYFPRSPNAEKLANQARQIEVAKSNSITLHSYADIWFEQKKIEWRPSYQGKIETVLGNYILPILGELKVDQITRANILDFRVHLSKVTYGVKQENLSSSRINQIMTPLRMLLQEASDQYAFESPFHNIKNLKELKSDVQPFTLDEVWKIIKSVRSDYKNYYIVRFFTGLRTGEIDGLRWQSIDLERKELHVKEALVNGKMGPPKTQGSNRIVQLPAIVVEALEDQAKRSKGKSQFVFCNKNGDPLEYRNVNRRIWHPTLLLLGIEKRRAYQTRHTAATLWLAAGENPEWIARQLGHSNTEMLFRVYSRYVPDLTRRDGSAFDQLLDTSIALTGANIKSPKTNKINSDSK